MYAALQTALPEHLALAASPQLAENSRLGFAPVASTSQWASGFSISSNTLGLSGSLYDGRIGSCSTGKERDAESGNDYFGARYYASSMGRWLSPDEAFADQHQANPQTWNLYAYTRNNPLRFVDQDGNVVHEAKTVYKTYDVHGKTAQDAADNALKASGMSADGEGMSGDTNAGYKIASSSLTFDQEMDGIQGQAVYDTMTLKSWVIQYTPVVTMPHWVEEGQASEADQKAWDTSMATLKKHEDGHVDIGRKGAHDLDDSLKGTKVTGSGATANEAETSAIKKMNADLRQKVKTNVEQTGQKQKDYDAATNHGRNQPQ